MVSALKFNKCYIICILLSPSHTMTDISHLRRVDNHIKLCIQKYW